MEPLIELPEEAQESKKDEGQGKPRFQTANRQQIEMRLVSLDSLIPEGHKVRVIWEMVLALDLSRLYQHIRAVEGEAGRPAIDPRLLVAVWIYATSEGVGSARAVEKLCQEHLAYQWLMGGVGVNYHTLADFRVRYEPEMDEVLTKSVAALMAEGIVQLERTAQDGIKIRASAGIKSFRRREGLERLLAEAKQQVEALKAQEPGHMQAFSRKQQAGRERAVQERVKRLKKSLEEIRKIEEVREKVHRKHSEKDKQKKTLRCSSTDPESRMMKEADGGYRADYNGQLSIDTRSGILVGVDVTNEMDQGQMVPMLNQLKQRYHQQPQEHLVDGGFVAFKDLETAHQRDIRVYAPLPKPRGKHNHPELIKPKDTSGVKAWRERMATQTAQEIYKLRATTIEWANACLRNMGLYRFLVRGMKRVRAVLLWYVLAHNLLRAFALQKEKA